MLNINSVKELFRVQDVSEVKNEAGEVITPASCPSEGKYFYAASAEDCNGRNPIEIASESFTKDCMSTIEDGYVYAMTECSTPTAPFTLIS